MGLKRVNFVVATVRSSAAQWSPVGASGDKVPWSACVRCGKRLNRNN